MQTKTELKCGNLKILKPNISADRVHQFRMVYNSTHNSLQANETLHYCNIVYLQHGVVSCCRKITSLSSHVLTVLSHRDVFSIHGILHRSVNGLLCD